MKSSFWNILSIFVILGAILVALLVGSIYSNPNIPLNPFPPATLAPTIFVPTATATAISLPPTWTPTGVENAAAPATPEPRPTATPIPTRTPFVLPSPTKIPALVLPTNVREPLEGQCKVTDQDPEDGTRLKFDSEFKVNWTIQNTSDETWESSEADVRFKTGRAMHTGNSITDLSESVSPGETTTISVNMVVPDKEGYHITYWSISQGSTPLCTFYVEIFAEK